jgi:hypothetical protein
MDPITALIVSVTGGLIVASVTGLVAYARGKKKGVQEYEQQCEAHIKQYSKLLGERIRDAHAADDYEVFVIKALSIVKARDDFKEDLDDLRMLLNSTIDELSNLLQVKGEARLNDNQLKIRRLVGVLHETWGGKEPLIESKLRALLAKLGIYRRR